VILLGFNLWKGSGDTKMHTPKNRNSPGTLLEPCWNLCWNFAGTSLEPCWNIAVLEPGETLLQPLGALLLEPLAGTSFREPLHGWTSFVFLYCFLLCLMCRVVMLEVWF